MSGRKVSSGLLVRHPAPFSTESLFGYILRLSQENGYTTPWSLFLTAAMEQHEIRGTGIKITKLGRIANRSSSELEAIAYYAPGRRSCRLLRQRLVLTDLELNKPKLCPQCVSEKDFIEAYWDLTLMTGCPVHKQSLLSSCPVCGRPLRWFRRGLLECQCGANLQNASLQSISLAEASLLNIIRAKVLRITSTDNPSALPISDLQSLDLRALLFVIRTLGKQRMMIDNADWHDCKGLVRAAARVLEHWPTNFFRLLQEIGTKSSTKNAGESVRRQFATLYGCLFKYRAIAERKQVEFLKIAFLDFVSNHWGRGFVDYRLIEPFKKKLPVRRFQTVAAMARQLGVDPRTARRLLEDKKILRRKDRRGKCEYSLIDSDLVDTPRTCPGRIYPLRKAAAMMGLPISVLKNLKASGDYHHRLPTRPGFHELDVREFTKRISDLGSSSNAATVSQQEECITLRTATSRFHGYLGGGAAVVRAVLSRTLPIGRSIDGTAGGVLIPHKQFHLFAESARRRYFANTRSFREAARDIRCESRGVPDLLARGLLESKTTPTGVRVTEESIAQFKRDYASLAAIAKASGTSSFALQNVCRNHTVSIIFIRKDLAGCRQPFIRRIDLRFLPRRYSHFMCNSVPIVSSYGISESQVIVAAAS